MGKLNRCNFCKISKAKAFWLALIFALLFIVAMVTTVAGVSHSVDQAVFSWLVELKRGPLGTAWVVELARDITALGSITVLVMISLSVVGLMLVQRHFVLAVYLTGVVAGVITTSSLLKLIIARSRPQDNLHLTQVFSSSFPSAHAMHSMAVYLSCGFVLVAILKSPAARVYVLCVALLLPLMIGASRVFLGVHWPIDVVAGWAAGVAWAFLCMSIGWRCFAQVSPMTSKRTSD